MHPVIKLDNISVAFQSSTEGLRYALHDFSLSLKQGDFIGVVGANGSGKTTLAQVLAGILPVSKGHLDIDGRIAMVFQNPDAQVIGETIWEDICFGLENRAIPVEEMAARVTSVLQQVGLDVPVHRRINTLSGGQRQLHCIAAALAMEPDIFIFDEATAMLNPPARVRMIEVARALNQRGTTVIWITQWLEELAYVDKVVALANGQSAFVGSPSTFFYGSTAAGVDAPCLSLGWEPPFAVRTAHLLQANGIQFQTLPLTLEDLAGQVNLS